MKIPFFKYQGTGNDFILVDNRNGAYQFSEHQIQKMCDRKFGIGADGFMMLEKSETADFKMRFWNNDGSNSMMCGNGGRCIVAFANFLKIFENNCHFEAPDGIHYAEIFGKKESATLVSLSMCDTEKPVQLSENEFFINTGSPHLVVFVKDVKKIDLYTQGKELRNDQRFAPDGTNVDFVEMINENKLFVRTFERGVENETLSCGTGVTASAIVDAFRKPLQSSFSTVDIQTYGGALQVNFESTTKKIINIHLVGDATIVFQGFLKDK